jgi:hypothetical protein
MSKTIVKIDSILVEGNTYICLKAQCDYKAGELVIKESNINNRKFEGMQDYGHVIMCALDVKKGELGIFITQGYSKREI